MTAAGRRALADLARELGVQTRYTDATGRTRTASPDAVEEVCAALLGADLAAGPARAVRNLRRERAARPAAPVAVGWDGACTVAHRRGMTAEIEQEPGTRLPADVGLRRSAAGTELRALPPGVHRLHLRGRGREQAVHVISAPRRAYTVDRRRWGSFLPLYAIPGSYGVGDFTGLRSLVDWTVRHGGAFCGSTPLFASFLDKPFDPSPYAPVSRLFWNELFVDPAASPELKASQPARDLLASPGFQSELRRLRRGRHVDYRASMAAKRRVLELLCNGLDGDRERDLDRLLRRDRELRAYAEFRARCEAAGRGWDGWGGERPDPRAARYHAYVQLLCREQIAEAAAGDRLYLDMPLGVHPSGFDTWRHRDLFARGLSVGAPPDALFRGGQDWGFPPILAARSREEGHAYYRACLRMLMDRSCAVRIDHVMGLHRLFCVPHGHPATEGVYVRMPQEELYALLTLESARTGTEVVGEDLGTVPSEVRRAMRRHGVLRSFVLELELGPDGDPFDRVPADALVGMNTHDMPTFAGFWEGEDIDRRVALGLETRAEAASERRERTAVRRALGRALRKRGRAGRTLEQALDGSLGELASSPGRLMVVNVEDLWGEREPQNVPGTSVEAGNWTRRAARRPSQFDRAPGVRARLAQVEAARSGP
ncbi:MAG TPA: 4-alpha-glucanotransferase [Gaiellales bacterium]|nr:4-alpha-glucanotransferase [Gaiellales bacterium]